MIGILVASELGQVLVQKQGIFTMRADDVSLECNCPNHRGPCGGIEIRKIPLKYRSFELLCNEMGKRFIERQKARSFEWAGGTLLLHGPWPSKVRNLVDIQSPTWNEAMVRDKEDGWEHPERVLGFVSEPDGRYLDYVLVGNFLFKDQMTDLELST